MWGEWLVPAGPCAPGAPLAGGAPMRKEDSDSGSPPPLDGAGLWVERSWTWKRKWKACSVERKIQSPRHIETISDLYCSPTSNTYLMYTSIFTGGFLPEHGCHPRLRITTRHETEIIYQINPLTQNTCYVLPGLSQCGSGSAHDHTHNHLFLISLVSMCVNCVPQFSRPVVSPSCLVNV